MVVVAVEPWEYASAVGLDEPRRRQRAASGHEPIGLIPGAARIGERDWRRGQQRYGLHAPGAPTVLIGNLPAARIGDMATCVGPPDVIAMGSATVLTMNMPQARMGDNTAHGGVIVMGMPTVLVGG